MDKPEITDTKSMKLELSIGTHAWCSCGRTGKSPMCDGSHVGTGFKPLLFEVEKKEVRGYCQCKYTKNPPYCDGSHRDL